MRSNGTGPKTGVCEVCGAAFVLRGAQKVKGARYCSRRCYGDAKRFPPADPRVCEECGASFVPTWKSLRNPAYQGRYCSTECSNIARRQPLAERFWEKVDRSGGSDACWPWLAARDKDGYGLFAVDHDRQRPAHAVAYELATGTPLGDLIGCHRCDNPPCCNPAHVFAGTHGDNARDREAKGRGRRRV